MSAKPENNVFEQFSKILQQGTTQRVKPGWWNSFFTQETLRFEPEDLIKFAQSAMFTTSLTQGGTVYSDYFDVEKHHKLDLKKLEKELSLELVFKHTGPGPDGFCMSCYFFVNKNSALQVFSNDLYLRFYLCSMSEKTNKDIKDKIKKYLETQKK